MVKEESILIVDDTEANIDILIELLNKYDLLVALDGKSAIEIIEKEKIDLILLDIMMPQMDGYEVCKILKTNPKTKELPIIFLTAKNDEESIEKAYDMGGVDYVTKPFKPKELLAKVKIQLENKRMIKELEVLAFELNSINMELKERVKREVEKSRKKDNLIFQQNKMASLGEMIRSIAHQWRQPLAELSMSQNVIIGKIGNNSITFNEIVEKIQNEQKIVKFMSQTIDNFQSFYKDDKEVKEFYIYKAYENVKYLLDETMKLNSIKIMENIDKSIKYMGNIHHLSQVILSIFQNSIIFFKSRNIIEPKIKISIYKLSNVILIEIEDNAKGIDENIISKIFDYNFSKRENEENSTGIGLYISKLIIEEKLKGKIKVENNLNGAKFTIILQS